MTPRLTRRGRTVVFACLLAAFLAWFSGARALNAVVVPGAVALATAYLQVRSFEPPRVDRTLPPDGFVGERHQVTLRFLSEDGEEIDRPFVATVVDALDDRLEGRGATVDVAVGAAPIRYEVSYEARGEATLGPTRLRARDAFGLFERSLRCPSADRVLVYPRRRSVAGRFGDGAAAIDGVDRSPRRDEFDRLREYDRGDALRDVHWPTTAKRGELVVKAFAADERRERATISAGAAAGRADAMAEAAASLALELLDAGVPVSVSLPNGSVDADGDRTDRRRLLRLAATAGTGAVPDPDADVVIDATASGTTIDTRAGSYEFEELLADEDEDSRRAARSERSDRAKTRGTVAADGGRDSGGRDRGRNGGVRP